MKLRFTKPYLSFYAKLPEQIQKRVDKQLRLLLENPKHPSLRLYKMKGREQWEISVTMNYQIVFEMNNDESILRSVGTHDILDKS